MVNKMISDKHLLVFAVLMAICRTVCAEDPAAPKSRVTVVQNNSAVGDVDIDAKKIRVMVAAGIKALTEQTDEAAAWRTFVSSNDVVGIKVNTQAAPLHGTHVAVVNAIADGLLAAGVPAINIVVFDRDANKLRVAGFTGTERFRVVSAIPNGWDAEAFYESRLVGKLIWGDLGFGKESEGLATRSHLPKVLTRTITKLINVPVLQDHEAAGIAGCLYNISLGAVDNARRFEQFGGRTDAAIIEINQMPAIRGKLVLNVMDALVGGYAGGPAFKVQYSFDFGRLYFSRDPVAIDALCLEQLEAKRKAANVAPIGDTANHLKVAAKIGLGQNEREKIELINLTP